MTGSRHCSIVGVVWRQLVLEPNLQRLTRSLFLFATYTNWGGSCLAATWGTSLLTPLSSAGHSAEAWKESIVQVLQISVALTVLTAAILVVYALRPSVAQTRDASG